MVVLSVIFLLSISLVFSTDLPPRSKYPHIVAHRGASGYLPEHSLQAYQLALDLETDYIEPDLVLTKDGIFIAMHDLLLDDTTNVADFPEFESRYTTKIVDGSSMSGYFVSDFLYDELLQLSLKQRLDGRSTLTNWLFTIPTLDQIISLVKTNYNDKGIMRGFYPELKHVSYHQSLGFDMDDMFLSQLSLNGFDISGENVATNLSQVLPVVIQCFEADALRNMSTKTDIPLILLVDNPVAEYFTVESLKEISSFADGIGPEKTYLGELPYELGLEQINKARTYGLYIHPWTFRADMGILPRFNNNFAKEQTYFYYCLGIDGLFSEFPDRSREVIDSLTVLSLEDKNSYCKSL